MENEHVLGGLTRKRAEIAGQIEHTQAALRKLVTDLDAIDAAIRIFDPEADIGAIKAKAYPPRHAAFRGEMMRSRHGMPQGGHGAGHKPRYRDCGYEGARAKPG